MTRDTKRREGHTRVSSEALVAALPFVPLESQRPMPLPIWFSSSLFSTHPSLRSVLVCNLHAVDEPSSLLLRAAFTMMLLRASFFSPSLHRPSPSFLFSAAVLRLSSVRASVAYKRDDQRFNSL